MSVLMKSGLCLIVYFLFLHLMTFTLQFSSLNLILINVANKMHNFLKVLRKKCTILVFILFIFPPDPT